MSFTLFGSLSPMMGSSVCMATNCEADSPPFTLPALFFLKKPTICPSRLTTVDIINNKRPALVRIAYKGNNNFRYS